MNCKLSCRKQILCSLLRHRRLLLQMSPAAENIHSTQSILAAASIWFEVWRVVNPVPEIFNSNRKNFRFSGKFQIFSAKNVDNLFLVLNPKISKNWPFSANMYLLHLHSYKMSLISHKKTFPNFHYVLSVQNTL